MDMSVQKAAQLGRLFCTFRDLVRLAECTASQHDLEYHVSNQSLSSHILTIGNTIYRLNVFCHEVNDSRKEFRGHSEDLD